MDSPAALRAVCQFSAAASSIVCTGWQPPMYAEELRLLLCTQQLNARIYDTFTSLYTYISLILTNWISETNRRKQEGHKEAGQRLHSFSLGDWSCPFLCFHGYVMALYYNRPCINNMDQETHVSLQIGLISSSLVLKLNQLSLRYTKGTGALTSVTVLLC